MSFSHYATTTGSRLGLTVGMLMVVGRGSARKSETTPRAGGSDADARPHVSMAHRVRLPTGGRAWPRHAVPRVARRATLGSMLRYETAHRTPSRAREAVRHTDIRGLLEPYRHGSFLGRESSTVISSRDNATATNTFPL